MYCWCIKIRVSEHQYTFVLRIRYLGLTLRPVHLAYQPPANSTFLSEQTSHQQPANSTFLSEKPAPAISHQPNEQAVEGRRVPWLRRRTCPFANPNEIGYAYTPSTTTHQNSLMVNGTILIVGWSKIPSFGVRCHLSRLTSTPSILNIIYLTLCIPSLYVHLI
jgi:hypothetical protein